MSNDAPRAMIVGFRFSHESVKVVSMWQYKSKIMSSDAILPTLQVTVAIWSICIFLGFSKILENPFEFYL